MGMFSRGASSDNSGSTVAAATGRRDRDSKAAGANTPQEQQMQVSQGLHETAANEQGRYCPGEGPEDAA